MKNELIQKFMKENGLGELEKTYTIVGIGLKDKDGNTMLIVKPPFTENLIECYFDDKKTSYQLKKGIDGKLNWFLVD